MPSRKAQPETEGIETEARRVSRTQNTRSQSPARNRGHRTGDVRHPEPEAPEQRRISLRRMLRMRLMGLTVRVALSDEIVSLETHFHVIGDRWRCGF